MAGSEHSAEDRTEAATPKRLEQAREQGQLPVSRDLTMLFSLGGAALGLVAFAPSLLRQLAEQSAHLLGVLDKVRLDGSLVTASPVGNVLAAAAMLIGAVALPAAACSIGGVLVQTQFYVGGAPIRFQASRISPAAGFARIASWRNVLDFLKSCLRLAILCLLAWSMLGRRPVESIAVIGSDVTGLLGVAGEHLQALARPMLVVLACFAAVDVLLVRTQHARSMRMTREQVRLEMREADGDPYVKAMLRRLREKRSRRRMMAKVKTADVVVTNPTHFAVALAYERGTGAAPRVVAKGADHVAARIRAEAEAHRVPVVPNPPLARALYQVELDREIPGEHYRAVAEVIAFVWKLKSRTGVGAGGAAQA